MYRVIAFLLFMLSLIVSLNAQPTTDNTSAQLLTPEQMREDVLFFYQKLLDTHPNPYQVLTPEQFEEKRDDILKSLDKPLSRKEFYKKIAVFNDVLDEHTHVVEWDVFAPMSEEVKQAKIVRDDKTAYPYKLSCFPEDSIALLELNTFLPTRLGLTDTNSNNKSSFDYDKTGYPKILAEKIDSVLAMNCKYLFIDVSANGGGSSSLAYGILDFLQVLTPQKYYVANADIKVSETSRKMWPYTFSSKWEYLKIPFNELYRQLFLGKKGKLVHHDFYWDYKGKHQVYNGNIYLIQSRASYSATLALCSFFKAYHVGLIFGEETGGKTNEYINSFPLVLPNSKYYFLCAVQYSEVVGSNKDSRGVLPDIEYEIENPGKSFTLGQLKEMLELAKNNL